MRAALSQQESEAPGLTNITIESEPESFAPRLRAEFSNGFRSSRRLSPGACFAFCERHAAWDAETLQRLLLRDARRIHAQMLQEHRDVFERGQQTWFAELMRRLSRSGRRPTAAGSARRRSAREEFAGRKSGVVWSA